MVSIRQLNPVARAVVVIGAVMALVTSVTFAALQSQATLTNNTISAADANLLLWDGDSFESTAPGFAVDDLVPGEWSEENFFYFQNTSDGALDVAASSTEPTAPEGGDYGFTGWENLRVRFTSYNPACTDDDSESMSTFTDSEEPEEPSNPSIVETTMADLIAGNVELPCNPLSEGAMGNSNEVGTEGNYSVSYKIAEDAVTGTDINIGSYDLTFTGTLTGSPIEE